MVDPNMFLDDPAAYIVHVKNCFYLVHTDFSKMKADLQPETFFGDYFTYFQLYWNLSRRREMINPIEFFIYTKTLYSWLDSGKKINGTKYNFFGFVIILKLGMNL